MKMKNVIRGLVVAAAIFATGTFGTTPSSTKAAGWGFPGTWKL